MSHPDSLGAMPAGSRRLGDPVRPRSDPSPFPVRVEGEDSSPRHPGIVERGSPPQEGAPDTPGRDLAGQRAVQGRDPPRPRRKLPEKVSPAPGRRPAPKPWTPQTPEAGYGLPRRRISLRSRTSIGRLSTEVDGGRKPRGCCARAAETFRPVTPGTLIRTKIAAASNRDKNVAATTVIAALIYANGRFPPGSALCVVPPRMPCRRSS